MSATKTLPTPSTAAPWGPMKLASAPVPSAFPGEPVLPASVVTTPAAVIFRMEPFPKSATKTLLAPSTATPQGLLKLAAAPVPSALPDELTVPASVVTTPEAAIFQMALL